MRAVNSAAMSGGLSWASVAVQVKPRGIFGQQGEVVRVLRRRFWSIPARHADGLPDLHLRPCVEARVLSPAQEWVGLPAWRASAVNELRVWGGSEVRQRAGTNGSTLRRLLPRSWMLLASFSGCIGRTGVARMQMGHLMV